MNTRDDQPEQADPAEARKRRLASALRENLKRRKAQTRGRAMDRGEADGPQAAPEKKRD